MVQYMSQKLARKGLLVFGAERVRSRRQDTARCFQSSNGPTRVAPRAGCRRGAEGLRERSRWIGRIVQAREREPRRGQELHEQVEAPRAPGPTKDQQLFEIVP